MEMVKRIVVTGGNGFLGRHLVKALRNKGHKVFTFSSNQYNLLIPDEAMLMLHEASYDLGGDIDILINLAARVGGIGYNQKHSYYLYYDNLRINFNIIHASIGKVGKFVQTGTACSYPQDTPMPFREESFWKGYPEETNAAYGIAKRVSLAQLWAARKDFEFNGIYLILSNLYGPGDDFRSEKSHVIPALIRKFLEKDPVTVWGSGRTSRDFLYVKDAVEAIILCMDKYDHWEPINIGTGVSTPIAFLAHHIRVLTNYKGEIVWDRTKPDGQFKKLSIQKIKNLGWEPKTSLIDGLYTTMKWYRLYGKN